MGNNLDTQTYEGPIIKVNLKSLKDIKESKDLEIVACSNDDCKNNTKNIGQHFCPLCGFKTELFYREKITYKDIYDVMEELDVWDVLMSPEYIDDILNNKKFETFISARIGTNSVKEMLRHPEIQILLKYFDEQDVEYKIGILSAEIYYP